MGYASPGNAAREAHLVAQWTAHPERVTATVAAGTVPYRDYPGRTFSVQRWIALVLPGETAGFVLPGFAWFAVWTANVPPLPAAAVVVLFGAGEGTVLGYAQWRALRAWRPEFTANWVFATSLSAMFAWACGMAPSTASDVGAPDWLAMVLGFSLMPLLLFSMPFAQWRVLRAYVPRAWRWVPLSIAAWVLALPPTFIGPMSIPDDSPAAIIAVTWLVSGLAMATILAFVTGLALRHLTRDVDEVTRR